MIVLDTSVLVEALGAGGALRGELREAIGRRERIAATALAWRARLWTLNRDNFEEIPGLELV